MLIDDVNEIINTPFEEVIASSLSLKLLKCYSMLYLHGGQPGTCATSQRKYYQQLIKNGILMADKLEQAKKRTCRPAWDGVKYVPATARHWNSELLTDEEAKMLLKKKFLSKDDFLVLPSENESEFSEAEEACITEISDLLQKNTTKDQVIEKYKEVKKIGEKTCNKKLLEKLISEAEKRLNEAAE